MRRDCRGAQRLSVNRSEALETPRDQHTLEKPLWLDLHDLSGVLARGHDKLEPENELWWRLMLEHGRRRVDVNSLIGSVLEGDTSAKRYERNCKYKAAHLMVRYASPLRFRRPVFWKYLFDEQTRQPRVGRSRARSATHPAQIAFWIGTMSLEFGLPSTKISTRSQSPTSWSRISRTRVRDCTTMVDSQHSGDVATVEMCPP